MTENIKKDLTRSLADEKIRQAYLHPKKHSIFQIYKYAYVPIRKDKALRIKSFFYSLFTGINPIISAFIMSYLVGILSKDQASFQEALRAVIIYSILFLTLTIGEKQIYYRTYNQFSRIRIGLLHDFCKKLMTMDYGLYENSEFLDHISRGLNAFASNNSGLEGSYHRIFDLGGQTLALVLLGLILLALSPGIFLAGLLAIFILTKLNKLSASYQHQRVDKLNVHNRRLDSFAQTAADFKKAKDLRLYFFQDLILEKLGEFSKAYTDYFSHYKKMDKLLAPVLALVVVAVEALAYYFIYQKIGAGSLSPGRLTLFISALGLFIFYLNKISDNLTFISRELLFYQDGIDFFQADLNSTRGDQDLDSASAVDIEFKNVSFSYPVSQEIVLDNLSFKLEKGQRLALVGVNGAGKSTIAKLLLGLYKPSKGQILLNGVDLNDLSQEAIKRLMTGVFQEVDPLAMTIEKNVASTKENIDRQRVWQVLDQVGLGDKVRTYKDGLQRPLTKIIYDHGTLLSGGENQKLAIAKALYKKDAQIIVMDEPTASLDALAEEKIYKDLDRLVGAKTLIFISHRLASTRFCDKIALLDGGAISEFGTHQELMAKGGLYKEMYDTQGKYYKEDKEDKANG
ncbi:MAG: ABC transporter ATP-binding protein [Bacillota bacterium]|nr:ABC transporter ATP-binding protein [Bacillota bacterium]